MKTLLIFAFLIPAVTFMFNQDTDIPTRTSADAGETVEVMYNALWLMEDGGTMALQQQEEIAEASIPESNRMYGTNQTTLDPVADRDLIIRIFGGSVATALDRIDRRPSHFMLVNNDMQPPTGGRSSGPDCATALAIYNANANNNFSCSNPNNPLGNFTLIDVAPDGYYECLWTYAPCPN